MAQKASDEEVCHALLDFISDGTYPGSENVIASEFPASALSKEIELISNARKRVEVEISSLSRENDFDADGWISQAKQLHADIERSRLTAREIVAQHENTRPLQLKVDDAAAKVALIETEIAFNQAVAETLEEVQRLSEQLNAGRAALRDGQITIAIDAWEATDRAIKEDSFYANTNVLNMLSEDAAGLRREIDGSLQRWWSEQLMVDKQEGRLTVANHGGTTLNDAIAALTRLDMLAKVTDKFQRELISAIVDPILLPSVTGQSRSVRVGESGIEVDSDISVASVSEVLDRIVNVLSYLRQHLPTAIFVPFSEIFIPTLSSKVISSWLSPAIPTGLSGLNEFEKTLDAVLSFSHTIESLGLHGHEDLVSWVNQAPRLWLTRRRVDSLDQVRRVLAASQYTTKQVERTEKEKVSQEDESLLENAASDDWDAGWNEDNDEAGNGKPAEAHNEDEDMSAWGLDEDTKDEAAENATATAAEEDDAEDAWGWGDEEEDQQDHSLSHAASTTKPVNGHGATKHTSQREVILREKYTVTGIPDSILDIVEQQIMDSEAISQPTHSHSRVTTSGAGLLALPTLILAMFKATASSFYTLRLNSGQMYLYNDSLYLAERIRVIVEQKQLMRLNSDIDALEKFGKFSYSKEMQTQRTIVTDLLDGAQGFGQCSEQPFLGECENAVSATVDRIRDVYKEWQPILSHSALLQSIGSLLSSVVNKIIIDIEDLGDISEPQSRQLVSFCTRVSQLEDLFTPESTPSAEGVPMTAVYVRSWLKFQYLINILESSLADIKFLWLEGELRLEFSPEEVVDLVEALFAESDYRRKAIAEIRRTSRG